MEIDYVGREQIAQILGDERYQLWLDMHLFLLDRYHVELVWNYKQKENTYECRYKTAGRPLLTLELKPQKFVCLIILGQAERDLFEEHRQEYSKEFLKLYDETPCFHDGKWLFYGTENLDMLQDVKKILLIKKKPNVNMAICGYCCDRCQANRKNSKKKDQRERISTMWKKYYGFYIPPEECNCDGCKCKKKDALHLDSGCPIRECHIKHEVEHCYECTEYPCDTFRERVGLSLEKAKEEQGDAFSEEEFERYLETFDNSSRNERIRKSLGLKK